MPDEQLQLGEDESAVALRQAWARALQALAQKVNKASFESWIRPIRPMSYDPEVGRVTLGAASPFARDWLKKYAADIQTALREPLGRRVEVHFELAPADKVALLDALAEPDAADAGEMAAEPEAPKPAPRSRPTAPASAPPPDDIPSMPLNPAYTFDAFVVGRSNRLACAGAMAVAQAPGVKYNPLFLYGSPGLGKTHLLHAIGNEARARDPGTRVAVVDGENFTEHYVTALRERKVEAFRRRYRAIDIWLVDDIQFIAGKEQTKEEFFHTFNALYQTGRQIVIASDRSPRELRSMDERLRSRFESGLIADINVPELETREEILARRCEAENWQVPPEVRYYIASAIQSNIRALQGALTRLVAYASVMGAAPSVEVAEDVLGEYVADRPPLGRTHKDVPVEVILRTVAETLGTSVEALRGERRDRETAKARQVAMLLCRELAQLSLAQIGAALGGRDHTTVQRGIAKMESTLPYDRPLLAAVQQMRQKLER